MRLPALHMPPMLKTRAAMACIIASFFLVAGPTAAQTLAVWEEFIVVTAPGYTDGPLSFDAPGAASQTEIRNFGGVSYVAHANSTSVSGLIPVTQVQGNFTLSGPNSGGQISIFSSVTYAVQPVALPGAPAGINFVPVSVRVRGEATALISGISGRVRSAQGLVQQRDDQGGVQRTFQAAAGISVGVGFDSFDTTYFPLLPTNEETFFFVRASGLAGYLFGFEGPMLDFQATADPEITITTDLIPGTAIPYSDAFEIRQSPNLVPEPGSRMLQIAGLLSIAGVCQIRRRRR
jgi:hypothetical protein